MGFTVTSGGVELAGESAGDGVSVVLLHGLTATRDVVVHGSKHLERKGFRVVAYDARGHGASAAAPEGSYGYVNLADDVEAVVAVEAGEGRTVLVGHSMGAHTIAAAALRDPGRYAGVVLIGPAVEGEEPPAESLEYWGRLADGLERGGVEGFIEAYDVDLNPEWRETILRITRARLARHEHPEGVVRALREVPRSVPFDRPSGARGARRAGAGRRERRRGGPGPPVRRRGGVGGRATAGDADQRGAGRVAAGVAGRAALARDRGVLRRGGRCAERG